MCCENRVLCIMKICTYQCVRCTRNVFVPFRCNFMFWQNGFFLYILYSVQNDTLFTTAGRRNAAMWHLKSVFDAAEIKITVYTFVYIHM